MRAGIYFPLTASSNFKERISILCRLNLIVALTEWTKQVRQGRCLQSYTPIIRNNQYMFDPLANEVSGRPRKGYLSSIFADDYDD